MQHQQARDTQVNGRRQLGPPDVNNVEQFPPAGLGGAAALPNNLPPINMDNMVELYRRVEDGEDGDNKVMMKSVFGILLHNASSMQSVEQVKRDVHQSRSGDALGWGNSNALFLSGAKRHSGSGVPTFIGLF